MPDILHHPAALPFEQLRAECEVHFLRRSGPGGQHRNKVSTAAVVCHKPTGVKAEANERRSQAENLRMAMFRLRVNLALHIRVARDDAQVPSLLWASRCHGGRMAISPSHEDFPTLLAELLDVLAICEYDHQKTAETLRCSASQLVRLLKKEPQALLWANAQRARLRMRPLL